MSITESQVRTVQCTARATRCPSPYAFASCTPGIVVHAAELTHWVQQAPPSIHGDVRLR